MKLGTKTLLGQRAAALEEATPRAPVATEPSGDETEIRQLAVRRPGGPDVASRLAVAPDASAEVPDQISPAFSAGPERAGSQADLILQRVEIEGDRMSLGEVYDEPLQAGDEVTVEWEVKNIGSAVARSTEVHVWLASANGVLIKELATNGTVSLDPNEVDDNEKSDVELPDNLAPGRYMIVVTADAAFEVAESNESNNLTFFYIDVVAPPPILDVIREGTDTTASLSEGSWRSGRIDAEPISGDGVVSDQQGGMIDKDWYRVTLERGHVYRFEGDEQSLGTGSVAIALYNAAGQIISSVAEGSAPWVTIDTTGQSNATQVYYLAISAGGPAPAFRTATGDYRVRYIDQGAVAVDTVREGTDTTARLQIGETLSGRIDPEPIAGDGVVSDQSGGMIDKDWYRVTLERGRIYQFDGDSTSVSTGQVSIALYDQNGVEVRSFVEGSSPSFTFDTSGQSTASQTYYVAVSAGGPAPAWRTATGNYTIGVTDTGAPPPPVTGDDFGDDHTDSPIGQLEPDGSITGRIGPADADDQFGDKDVFAIHLMAGEAYDFRLQAITVGGASLPAGLFTIRDDDFDTLATSGAGADVTQLYVAERSGLHYVRVGSGGSVTDTGGYRLSVETVDRPATVPDDWADFTGDTGSPGALAPGGNLLGIIETAGDRDYFTVTLEKGKSYHFSVASEARPGFGAIDTVAFSIRGTTDFSSPPLVPVVSGDGRTGVTYIAEFDGQYYLRVGAGSDGSDLGGYRVVVGEGRAPATPTFPPSPDPSNPIDYAFMVSQWVSSAIVNFDNKVLNIYFDDEIWNTLASSIKNISAQDSLFLIHKTVDQFKYLGLAIDAAKVIDRVGKAEDFGEALYVEFVDWFVGSLFHGGGNAVGGLIGAIGGAIGGAGALSGPLAGLGFHLGRLVGGLTGTFIYNSYYQAQVREDADISFDGVDDSTINGPREYALALGVDDFGDSHTVLDQQWYLDTYDDARQAVEQGAVGSAYAHYLTIGIDLGYRPNAAQFLSRADLAFGVLNNDPAALGNSALFIQSLGQLAGDGVSTGEQAVAAALQAAGGAVSGASLDARLSALAHRKALDLAVNAPLDAIAAADASSSAWAGSWSDGADFDQAFAAEIEALVGAGAGDGAVRLFVVASASGSAAEVLGRLQASPEWTATGHDAFGIAEFGGLWIVITVQRAPGVGIVVPGSDALLTGVQYGSGEDETLYAGLRSGRLYGLGGEDTLHGGAAVDHIAGGDGDDIVYAAGGNDVIRGGVGQDRMYGQGGADTYLFDAQDSPFAAGDVIYDFASGSDRLDLSALYRPGLLLTTTTDGSSTYLYADLEADGVWDFVLTAVGGHINGDDIFIRALGQEVVGLTMFGHGGNDTLTGGHGADILVGGAGEDLFNGGAGIDTVHYGSAAAAVTARLDMARATADGDGASDTLLSVENLTGSAFNDSLTGSGAVNVLDGGAGNDQLSGLNGDDILRGGAGVDILIGGGGIDTADYSLAIAGVRAQLNGNVAVNDGDGGTDTFIGIENLTGSAFDDTLIGDAGGNVLRGGLGSDTLIGLAGNDVLWGGYGALNTLQGGLGNDIYVLEAMDTVIEFAGEGTDTVDARINAYALGANIENLIFGGVGSFTGTGNALANTLTGGAGADILRGRGGNDTLIGGLGIDTADYSPAAAGMRAQLNAGASSDDGDGGADIFVSIENLTGSAFDDTLIGDAGGNVLRGGLGSDTLLGLAGNDVLWGGSGAANQLQGGLGDDLYVLEVKDTVVELAGQGIDTVESRLSTYVLGLNLENLIFGGAGNFTGMGNGLANTLTGGAGDDLLRGRGGNDTLVGGEGFDTADYSQAAMGVRAQLNANRASTDGDGGADTFVSIENLTGSAFDDTLIGDAAGNVLRGGVGSDTLIGLAGDDVLWGGAGQANTLQGGIGNDRYVVEAIDTVVELAGEGVDTVESRLNSYTLGLNFENLSFGGAGDFTGTGNALANVLTGGAGADVLRGRGGNDTLVGGGGIDTADYSLAVAGVRAQLNANAAVNDGDGGTDTFISIENLIGSVFSDVLIGDGGANVLRGGLGSDTLLGLAGNDVLWGGAGQANILQGGVGDDLYVLEAGDTVFEVAGEGVDTVDARINTYLLSANVENLIFGGVGNFTGTGNALANILTGGAGADVLRGRAGNDTLIGGGGIDTADYSQAAAGVRAQLNVGSAFNDGDGGTDTLVSIENLTGSAFDDTLIGDATSNVLRGGLGSDTLIGLAGNDILAGGQGAANQLQGGLGDDLYILDARDTVVELAGQGIDTIECHIGAYTLGANVENIYYVGSTKFHGTGNALNNVLTGGIGDDILKGMGGNDRLYGGAGLDQVQLRGSKAQYTVTAEGSGYRIVDTVAGRDGSTFVASIETLRFLTGNTTTTLAYSPGPAPLEPAAKDAGEAQVLPGLADSDVFVLPALPDDQPLILPGLELFKDAGEPLILPGPEDRLFLNLEARLALSGAWMATLDSQGRLIGEAGRLGGDYLPGWADNDGFVLPALPSDQPLILPGLGLFKEAGVAQVLPGLAETGSFAKPGVPDDQPLVLPGIEQFKDAGVAQVLPGLAETDGFVLPALPDDQPLVLVGLELFKGAGVAQILPGIEQFKDAGVAQVLPGLAETDGFVLPALPDDQPLILPGIELFKDAGDPLILPGPEDRLFLNLEARLALSGGWMATLDEQGRLVREQGPLGGDDWMS